MHGDRRAATTIGLGDAGSMRDLDVLFARRQSFNQREQGLGGGDQYRFGAGVDGFEFFGDQYLPGGGVGLGFQHIDCFSGVAIVAELFLISAFRPW
jgi:hypothetical protein